MDIQRHLENSNITIDTDPKSLARFRREFANIRATFGFAANSTPLITGGNEKYGKSKLPTFGLSLAQAETSGNNVCRFSTAGCREVCVAQNGNGTFSSVQRGRLARNAWLTINPSGFISVLVAEIRKVAATHNGEVAFRLNTFSDIRWEDFLPANIFQLATFYDYTKWPMRLRPEPTNYALVRSVTERDTDADIIGMVSSGVVPVVVFDAKRHALPATFHGITVVDGDATDERFADSSGVIVGLAAKGRVRAMRASGFARSV